jgi:hypothetical protein
MDLKKMDCMFLTVARKRLYVADNFIGNYYHPQTSSPWPKMKERRKI